MQHLEVSGAVKGLMYHTVSAALPAACTQSVLYSKGIIRVAVLSCCTMSMHHAVKRFAGQNG